MAIAGYLKSMDLLMFARAAEGLSHFRGIAVSFAAMLIGSAFLFLGVYFAGTAPGFFGRLLLFICWIVYALVAGTGVSANGIMLLDKARLAPARSLTDVLVFGLICFIKCCVIGLAVVVAALVFALLAAIVYFICKIPAIGPVALFFAHPLLVVIAGLLGFLTSIFAALIAPAVWDGDSITRAIAKTVAVLKERAVVAVLYLLVMWLVTAIILAVIAAVVLPGYLSMTGLAAGILGPSLGVDPSMLQNLPFALMAMGGARGGHALALMLSTVAMILLWLSAALQVQLMGLNLVYLGASEGVDTAGAEQLLKRQLDQARAKAEEAKQRAIEAAERAKAAAQQARSAAPTPTAETRCSHCSSPYTVDDVFCENCGHKLK